MNAPSTATRDLRGGHREPQASLEVALKHLPRICPHRPIQVAIRRQKCTNRPRAIAVAQMPETMQRGTVMEVGDERFEFTQICELYNSDRYPLSRTARPPTGPASP